MGADVEIVCNPVDNEMFPPESIPFRCIGGFTAAYCDREVEEIYGLLCERGE